jgi:glycine dehydrogenase subunit 2
VKQELIVIHAAGLAEAAGPGCRPVQGAPFHAPMKRLDETRAARSPVLRWTAPEGSNIAAG